MRRGLEQVAHCPLAASTGSCIESFGAGARDQTNDEISHDQAYSKRTEDTGFQMFALFH